MKIKRDSKLPRELQFVDPRLEQASERVKKACDKNSVKFLEVANKDNIIKTINSGARVIAGQSEEAAIIGRKYTNRQMKV